MPLDGGHVELQPSVADDIADGRWAAEQHQNQPADAVDILVLEIEIELLPELVDPHRAGHAQPAFGVPIDLRRGRRAFFDVSNDLPEQILQRDDSGGPAVLVDDDDHLRALAAHGGQDRVELRGFRYERNRPRVSQADGFVAEQHTQ